MYALFVVQPPPGAEEFEAHGMMERFTSTGAANRARAGALKGCKALNNFTFELSGDFVRALADLQRGADEANVATRLMTFAEAPATAVAPPLRPINP